MFHHLRMPAVTNCIYRSELPVAIPDIMSVNKRRVKFLNQWCREDSLPAPCPPPPQTYKILQYVVNSFGMDSVHLTERSILDPCYEVWE